YQSAVDQMQASVNMSRAQLETSKARLAQSKANEANLEAVYVRNKKLFDQGAIAQSDIDAAKAGYEGAKADVEASDESVHAAEFTVKSNEASLKSASDNLAKTNIFAPVAGILTKLNVEKGERVVGTSQMAGTEMMTLANLNDMEVNVDVNENDIVRIHKSDTADIEVDAYHSRKFKGLVTEVSNSANTTGVSTDQVTNFTVKILILAESYQDLIDVRTPQLSPFRTGMSATVDIRTKSEKHVLSVPIQCVTTRSDTAQKDKLNGKKGNENNEDDLVIKDNKDKTGKKPGDDTKPQECVFIYDKGKALLRKVKTGIQDANYFQILEGLKEGEEVISAPYTAIAKSLKDGSKVEKVEKEMLYKNKDK
ncbi:MAG TPA: efflux RND transporter periplasmic adaptor subunit, partial [Bacteroidia bacterium]|nr:efflux RND transporter periplasmic adaptor subunit [Bacteroidia bacterium]